MSRFDEAAHFALDAHAGQLRKGDGSPYVLHPFEVASIAATITTDEDVLVAALLHDVVEDAGVSLAEVEGRFGARVATLVASETENKHPELPKDASWHLRKEESLAELAASGDAGVQVLWLSDKLANLRSFARLADERGEAMWQLFNQRDPAAHAWYYRRVAELTGGLASTCAWRELAALIERVFGPGEKTEGRPRQEESGV